MANYWRVYEFCVRLPNGTVQKVEGPVGSYAVFHSTDPNPNGWRVNILSDVEVQVVPWSRFPPQPWEPPAFEPEPADAPPPATAAPTTAPQTTTAAATATDGSRRRR